MPRTVLILGASGHAGRAQAGAFAAANGQVRRYRRGTDPAAAARGADLIVNAINARACHDRARQLPATTEIAMRAARAWGARVLIPGNVYVDGTETGPRSAATPHRRTTRKGAIRAQMAAAWRESGLPVTLLRAGDFRDPQHPG
jgi:nucleoside-diphosphate-sugar epimerase